MNSRNIIAAFYVAASLSSAVAMAKDSGFRYLVTTGQCINKKGDIGFNKGFFGECGDITSIKLFRQHKINKADLKYANLRGIQINGLDFSDKDMTGADLTGANLIGADLSNAQLQDAKLEKSKFNEATQLPFSIEEATARAMINIDFVGDRPADDSILNDILTVEDPSALTAQLAEIRRPQEAYLARLNNVFEGAKNLTLAQAEAFMDATYSQQEVANSVYDQILANQRAEHPDQELNEKLQKELSLQIDWSHAANTMLLTIISKKLDLTKLSSAEALKLCANAIPFTNYQNSDSIFSYLRQKQSFKEAASLISFISAANQSGAFSNAANATIELLALRGEISVDTMLDAANEFFASRDNGIASMFAAGIEKLETLDYDQLGRLLQRSKKDQDLIINAGISKLRALDAEQALTLLNSASYATKDAVLAKFFQLNSSVNYDHFVALIKESYQSKNDLIKKHINDIEELKADQAAAIIDMASYNGKDAAATAYLSALSSKITSAQFIAIGNNAYQERNNILKTYMNMVSDLNANNVKLMAQSASYNGKDEIILHYLADFDSQITSAELMELGQAAYQQRNNILSNYLASVSDLSPANVAQLANTASYNGKDSVIQKYLEQFNPRMSTSEMVNLAAQAYQEKNSTLSNHMGLITDFSTDNAITLMNAASYGTKDTILSNYLEKYIKAISAEDIIKMARAAYQDGTSQLMGHLGMVSPYDFNATLTLVNALSYNNKNVVIKRYIDLQATIPSQNLLTLAQKSYNIGTEILTGNLAKVSDLNQANALMLSGALSYSNKNVVLSFYLDRASALTTDQLIAVANASYQKQAEYISGTLDKVSDLTVANALRLKGAYSYSSLDTFLLKALEKVTDLNQNNLMTMANTAYQAKDRILSRGMEILLGK